MSLSVDITLLLRPQPIVFRGLPCASRSGPISKFCGKSYQIVVSCRLIIQSFQGEMIKPRNKFRKYTYIVKESRHEFKCPIQLSSLLS